MRKKLLTIVAALTFAIALGGCGTSKVKSVSNEYVKVNNYYQLQIEEVAETEVTDEMVESEIESNLQGATENKKVDRKAKNGDVVNIDYVGKIKGKKFDGGSAEGYELELGSGTFIGANGDYKSFEEQIVGHKAGDKFDIKVKFPDEYSEEVAGKVATFSITLNSVNEREVPTLNDSWVKENSETSKTVDEYKAEIKKQIEESNEKERKSELQSRILEALNNQIEVKKVPEKEKKKVAEQIRKTYESYASQYGLEFADFLSSFMGMTEDQFEEELDKASEDSAVVLVACQLIAEKEKLTPTEKEYQEAYKEYAAEYGYDDVDQFLEVADKEELDKSILQKNVSEYLVENAKQLSAEEMATATTQEESSETNAGDAPEAGSTAEEGSGK